MRMLSIIVPLYNEKNRILSFYQQLLKDLNQASIPYECIFIDNGSHDATLSLLRDICEKDFHCHYISMHHNISTMEAYYIGVNYAQGEYTLLMDTKHPSYIITKMYERIEKEQLSSIGGLLHNGNQSGTKKQRFFKMFLTKDLSFFSIEQDFDGFRGFLLHPQEDQVWIHYTNLEEKENTLYARFLTLLNVRYKRRFIHIILFIMFCTLLVIPSILITWYDLDSGYCFYISLLLTLSVIAMMEVCNSRYCSFHVAKHFKNIKESTFLDA